jgi:hypothetical protein
MRAKLAQQVPQVPQAQQVQQAGLEKQVSGGFQAHQRPQIRYFLLKADILTVKPAQEYLLKVRICRQVL